MGSVEIIDYYISGHLKLAHAIQEKTVTWDDVGSGTPKSMGETIASTHLELAAGLEFLKDTIIKERKIPKCKHIKKDRDISHNGVVYCMNCNSDLSEKLSPKKKN